MNNVGIHSVIQRIAFQFIFIIYKCGKAFRTILSMALKHQPPVSKKKAFLTGRTTAASLYTPLTLDTSFLSLLYCNVKMCFSY